MPAPISTHGQAAARPTVPNETGSGAIDFQARCFADAADGQAQASAPKRFKRLLILIGRRSDQFPAQIEDRGIAATGDAKRSCGVAFG